MHVNVGRAISRFAALADCVRRTPELHQCAGKNRSGRVAHGTLSEPDCANAGGTGTARRTIARPARVLSDFDIRGEPVL
jgi:hypothetical protein